MNPVPTPFPPQVNVQPKTPVQLPPQVNVQPNPALGGGMGPGMKRGGKVKSMSFGGSTSKSSFASKRADGIAQRGKTKGRMV
jgi:hypothetical protein